MYIGDADLGKSQFTSPFAQTPRQSVQVRRATRPPPLPGAQIVVIHPVILETRHQTWADEADCEAAARALARSPLLRHACLELHGTLGAGKTTFVRHLLRALGVQGRIKSPSYAIVEPHELPDCPDLGIWHFDFYRFGDPREWEDAGFRDLFASPGLKLVEWPEKAAGLLPQPDLALVLDLQPDGLRRVTWRAGTPSGRTLLAELPASPAGSAPGDTDRSDRP
ncbi:MAG: tRNA threonylcarbamoyladenosine biosynthesis protein TsaE [Pseudomonadota bacterium]|nr:tRNA threonylcarbamoyladenosine biosynthesis protein TsaE [Pseudomonadota bacterium]